MLSSLVSQRSEARKDLTANRFGAVGRREEDDISFISLDVLQILDKECLGGRSMRIGVEQFTGGFVVNGPTVKHFLNQPLLFQIEGDNPDRGCFSIGQLAVEEFEDTLMEWENDVDEYGDASNEEVSEKTRISVVSRKAPEPLRGHLPLNIGQY